MSRLTTSQEFILIDFEFKPKDGVEGNPLEVICMVSKNLTTGEYLRLWADDLYVNLLRCELNVLPQHTCHGRLECQHASAGNRMAWHPHGARHQ